MPPGNQNTPLEADDTLAYESAPTPLTTDNTTPNTFEPEAPLPLLRPFWVLRLIAISIATTIILIALLIAPTEAVFGCGGGIGDLGCAFAATAFSLLLANAAYIVMAVYAMKRFLFYSSAYAIAVAIPPALCVTFAMQNRLYQHTIELFFGSLSALHFYVTLGIIISSIFLGMSLLGIGFAKIYSSSNIERVKNMSIGAMIVVTMIAMAAISHVGKIMEKESYEKSQAQAMQNMGFNAYLPRYSPEGFQMSYLHPYNQSDLHPAYYYINYSQKIDKELVASYTIYEMPAQRSFNPPTDCGEASADSAFKKVPCQSLGMIPLGCELYYADESAFCQYKDTLITFDADSKIYANSSYFPSTKEVRAIFESLQPATADEMNAARKSIAK